MLLFRVLIVWVLLQGTPLVRDIFNLPLHDGRSLLVDASILLLCFCLFILNQDSKYQGAQSEGDAQRNKEYIIKHGVLNQLNSTIRTPIANSIINLNSSWCIFICFFGNIAFSRVALIWAVPGFFIYVSSKINESAHLIYFKQYMLFVALIQLIFWALRDSNAHSFFNAFINGSVLFLCAQVSLFALNIMQDGLYQDLISRNSFPVAMLIMGEICREANMNNMFKRFIIIGSISAAISSTKLFFLLLFFLIVINYTINKKEKSSHFRGFVSVGSHLFIISLPFIIPDAITRLMDIGIEEVEGMGANRYYIDDNIGSLVSRIYSFSLIISQENFWTIFGNNEMAMSDVVFWGYPVHNIYASIAYSHGALVLSIIILYHLAIYRFLRHHVGLGMILGFIIIYFNDICPMLSLLFIPYILRNNKAGSHTKRLHPRLSTR